MNTETSTKSPVFKATAVALIPLLLNGCSAYRLTDKNPQYTLARAPEATRGVCGVRPFAYEPTDPGDTKLMAPADLAKWNVLFYEAANRADMCGRTIEIPSGSDVPKIVDYVIDGKVTEFYFKQNWVPMFFPVYMGMTVITLGIYAIAAGPTTSTKVDFGFTVNVKNARTGALLQSFPEKFESTDVMTMYSDANKNPYGNPGLAFEPTINDAMTKISGAIALAEGKPLPSTSTTSRDHLAALKAQGLLSDDEYEQKLEALEASGH